MSGSKILAGRIMSSTGIEVDLIDRVTMAREEKKKQLFQHLGVANKIAPTTP